MALLGKKFWSQVLSSKDATSSKRLVTLIISLHFIIASFAVLYIAFYVIFYLPKGRIEPDLLALLKEVLEYDFYIILSGLGFITADNIGQMLLERAKNKNALIGAMGTPAVVVPQQNPPFVPVSEVNITPNELPLEPDNPESGSPK